jgi:hypothetical protein
VRQPQAGAIRLVEVRPKGVRLVVSVAWPLATVVANRTQRVGAVCEKRPVRFCAGGRAMKRASLPPQLKFAAMYGSNLGPEARY